MTESSALAIDNLNVHIGGQPVLTDVSLRVAPGEAVGLVGETGSGKTMTVRTATGLLHRLGGRITSGRVRVAGTDLTRGTDRDWRRVQGRTIALVPQSSMSSLDPLMSIGHQLGETVRALGGPTGGDRRAAVRGLLEAVQLTPDDRLLRAYPHELSGGMRQRVMIALALAGNPRILVADEPTTALDAAIRREILALLSSLRHSRGLGLLLVSHDLGSISATTDTTVVMYAGRTVEAGPTSEIFEQPAHPYTEALLAALPERTPPGTRIPAIGGRPPLPGEVRAGCAFAARCPVAEPACHTIEPPTVSVSTTRTAACLQHTSPGERPHRKELVG
ncbi:oligopeptide/dipeptide ABC transporter ATP-binding protein [Amycolatopsis bartoniae]|uniref:ABC transporter domain-containing protein n=1 Tax=Amycolatopsis bartoniae TaxID=941986 RepID=A0A8H9M5V1_9PSEU|nr:ABC transporter ATP-binding protein [Amycolatopsis bartoniae]MBB2933461.1 oligopeptide/dipeptide ABC transporter ATP-binding protein [Amycolatopsis bartoniae]TVT00405.1 ABC transporter ATP-binding protein [Amycolatopsis bartoniae]GHF59619.1 hypothetical protein GCM10017566_36500 [Amycolatopsis bartoniae]